MDIDTESGRPSKRQRTSTSDSENPHEELHDERARSTRKLKSRFESIFDKYGRDFEGIGDEIDLDSGNIIVDNGHVARMKHERDAGIPGDVEKERDAGSETSDRVAGLVDWVKDQFLEDMQGLGGRDVSVSAGSGDSPGPLEEAYPISDEADSLMGDPEPTTWLPAYREYHERHETIPVDEELDDSRARDEIASTDEAWWSRGWAAPIDDATWRTSPRAQNGEQTEHNTRWHSSFRTQDHVNSELVDYPWQATPLPEEMYSREARASPKYSESEEGSHTSIPGTSVWADTNNVCMGKKKCKWTEQEENILRHLRTTTNLVYKEIKDHLPGRGKAAIAIHWSEMMKKEKGMKSADCSRNYERVNLRSNRKQASNPVSDDSVSAKSQVDASRASQDQPFNTRVQVEISAEPEAPDENVQCTAENFDVPPRPGILNISLSKQEVPNSTSSTDLSDRSPRSDSHDSRSQNTSIEIETGPARTPRVKGADTLKKCKTPHPAADVSVLEGQIAPSIIPIKEENLHVSTVLEAFEPAPSVEPQLPLVKDSSSLSTSSNLASNPVSKSRSIPRYPEKSRIGRPRNKRMTVKPEAHHGSSQNEIVGLDELSEPQIPSSTAVDDTPRKKAASSKRPVLKSSPVVGSASRRTLPESSPVVGSGSTKAKNNQSTTQLDYESEDELSRPVCSMRSPHHTKRPKLASQVSKTLR